LPELQHERTVVYISQSGKSFDAIPCVDGPKALNRGRQPTPTFAPGHRLNSGPFGTMGVGPPFGVGVRPDTQVIVVHRDGSLGLNVMEAAATLPPRHEHGEYPTRRQRMISTRRPGPVARAIAIALALLVRPALAQESQLTVTATVSGLELPATLLRPDGPGPFPAIVIAHDCSGLGSRSSGAPRRWAAELLPQGYVILIPDSFTPRGMPDGICTRPGGGRLATPVMRSADVYGALAYLRGLDFVIATRIGLFGGSHGGATTLAAMVEPGPADQVAAAKRFGFTAAIALYPSCGTRYGAWAPRRDQGVPGPVTSYQGVYRPIALLLILIGAEDDWTPAIYCEKLAEISKAAGQPVDIRVYPFAHHAFDSAGRHRYVAERNNQFVASGQGATTAGHSGSWAAARAEVTRFFATHLKGAR
jgi:dienelactone hydrolase